MPRAICGRCWRMFRHRGPDEFGILLDGEAGLGNARLSIIDLSGGSQPIANEDESLWIVFNGEIFNYIELRAELEPRGHRFRTSSDTEVILHLYEEFGPRCLEKFNGQFAIAIWDTETPATLPGARPAGRAAPLLHPNRRNTLLFASEIKSILATGACRRRSTRRRGPDLHVLGAASPRTPSSAASWNCRPAITCWRTGEWQSRWSRIGRTSFPARRRPRRRPPPAARLKTWWRSSATCSSMPARSACGPMCPWAPT